MHAQKFPWQEGALLARSERYSNEEDKNTKDKKQKQALNDDIVRILPRSTAEEIQAHNKEIIDASVQFIAENLQSNPTIATEGTLFQNPSYFEDRILDTSSIIESPFCESDKTYIVDTIGLSNTNPPYRVAHMRENKPGTTNSNDNNLPQHTMQYDELSRMIHGNM